jgi:Protein of unknown function (DUF1572)
MSELSSAVSSGFAEYFEEVGAKLHKWVDALSEEQFWNNPFPYGNDIGHLVLHLTGNLNYYLGARIAASGYVRDRDREFSETSRPSKQQVLQGFDRAIALAAEIARQQSGEDWSRKYSAERSTSTNRFAIVLDCAAHADHHVGQIINLTREVTSDQAGRAAAS